MADVYLFLAGDGGATIRDFRVGLCNLDYNKAGSSPLGESDLAVVGYCSTQVEGVGAEAGEPTIAGFNWPAPALFGPSKSDSLRAQRAGCRA